jgi:hypothetical protein
MTLMTDTHDTQAPTTICVTRHGGIGLFGLRCQWRDAGIESFARMAYRVPSTRR